MDSSGFTTVVDADATPFTVEQVMEWDLTEPRKCMNEMKNPAQLKRLKDGLALRVARTWVTAVLDNVLDELNEQYVEYHALIHPGRAQEALDELTARLQAMESMIRNPQFADHQTSYICDGGAAQPPQITAAHGAGRIVNKDLAERADGLESLARAHFDIALKLMVLSKSEISKSNIVACGRPTKQASNFG